ncbi:hypothetical protein D5S17_35770 [Pseudonocardiaceae bacterium YIM PH 21723]|nr:hypothetical protein D5S17_35770 [Pseudonocardiaceae bacterium YIM PH 21723]
MVISTRTITYRVARHDSVRQISLSPEFHQHKPEVMASARLLAVCEWPCMDLLREDLQPHECSLGAWQSLTHQAPVPIGAQLEITAECTLRRGSYSEWQVEVRDEHELVGHAQLGFVTVVQTDVEQRLRTKQPTGR